ncbi:Small glutamine-rich tetratricopeptide repeat-containing protein alpha-like [Oopsacas minuta]|uniref:Small glutamine-rich tetratricopeptide repeat-containing protein alpha-like n=1 Tax=Oopsacas minuta TaxID=111878 RepID=A0AAV7K586_9METZ|nr:Small glutamine-rich tetratricopeptide repeat-containing protein alpha-like [Oopsacas minuta]
MASNNSTAPTEDKKKLVYSIMQMLQRDMDKCQGEGDSEKGETLEVVMQCLSEVYEVELESDANKYKIFTPLETLFEQAKGPIGSSPNNPLPVPGGGATPEDIKAGEEFKRQGNEYMKTKEYEQAITAYSKAIEYNDEKSEYYCNRAAAFSKTGKHDRAIEDCTIALGLKEDYARAHGRLGFAYYQLGKHLEAKKAYSRAIELEPDNAGYKHNLDSLERTLREKEQVTSSAHSATPQAPLPTSQPTSNAGGFGTFGGMAQPPQHQAPAFPGFGGQMPNFGGMGAGGMPNLGGMDMNSLMSNPAFMNMASQMMSDPNMMNMANQFASQMAQTGVNPMAGLMGNPGMFPQPPNPQQPPPNSDNKEEKKDEKKDKKDKDGEQK